MPTNWDTIATGKDCPFCAPRSEPNDYWESVVELDVSTLCLLKNQAYRGHCILIYDPRHATSPDSLTQLEWTRFAADAYRAMIALRSICSPDHMNAECLGNQMPHLHWHLIPRYKSDPRWLGPVWTTTVDELHELELSRVERDALMERLRTSLAS